MKPKTRKKSEHQHRSYLGVHFPIFGMISNLLCRLATPFTPLKTNSLCMYACMPTTLLPTAHDMRCKRLGAVTGDAYTQQVCMHKGRSDDDYYSKIVFCVAFIWICYFPRGYKNYGRQCVDGYVHQTKSCTDNGLRKGRTEFVLFFCEDFFSGQQDGSQWNTNLSMRIALQNCEIYPWRLDKAPTTNST